MQLGIKIVIFAIFFTGCIRVSPLSKTSERCKKGYGYYNVKVNKDGGYTVGCKRLLEIKF